MRERKAHQVNPYELRAWRELPSPAKPVGMAATNESVTAEARAIRKRIAVARMWNEGEKG